MITKLKLKNYSIFIKGKLTNEIYEQLSNTGMLFLEGYIINKFEIKEILEIEERDEFKEYMSSLSFNKQISLNKFIEELEKTNTRVTMQRVKSHIKSNFIL